MMATTLHDCAPRVPHGDPRAIPPTSHANQPVDLMRRPSNMLGNNIATTVLAMAGHDLRQPLQIITSAHDVLLTMLDNEKERTELAFAAEATARLAGMLDQLVEALHLPRHPSERLSSLVALRPLLKRLAAEFGRSARLKGVVLNFSAAPAAVLSHPVLLLSILRNLVRNAIDYTPSGGSVSVGWSRHGSDLRVEVRDTGAGIR